MRIVGLVLSGVLGFGVAMAGAQAPAGAPAGANGICKDGTYSMAASKSGACNGHKGVQTWYASTPAKAAAPSAKTTAPAAPAATSEGKGSVPSVAATPAPRAATTPTPAASTSPASTSPATSSKKLSPTQAAAAKTAAPGGGKGLVWVNTASNVYHCSDDPFYGKTKAGAYMTEADAKAKGAHGDRGANCAGK